MDPIQERVDRLEQELLELRALLAAPRPPATEAEAEGPAPLRPQLGRRQLLTGAATAAVLGAVATVGSASPATAADGDNLVLGSFSNTAKSATALVANGPNPVYGFGVVDGSYGGSLDAVKPALWGHSASTRFATGVWGLAASAGQGVLGTSLAGGDGVHGVATAQGNAQAPAAAVRATGTNGASGVIATSSGPSSCALDVTCPDGIGAHIHSDDPADNGLALQCENYGAGAAANFFSESGTGIIATASANSAIVATAGSKSIVTAVSVYSYGLGQAITAQVTSPSSTAAAVQVDTAASGHGGRIEITNTRNPNAGLYAATNGKGQAVRGVVTAATATAVAVRGDTVGLGTPGYFAIANTGNNQPAVQGRTNGNGAGLYGNSFTGPGVQAVGGRAAINLGPASKAGRPTTGAHSRGDLVVDSAGAMFLCTASGTPGMWVRFSVTPA